MISRDIDVQYLKLKKEIGETIFTAKDFTDKRRRFENINFQIRSGEIVALAGLNGPAKRVWPRVFIGGWAGSGCARWLWQIVPLEHQLKLRLEWLRLLKSRLINLVQIKNDAVAMAIGHPGGIKGAGDEVVEVGS